MCVLYVSFGYMVRPITFWCVAMGSTVLVIFRSRLLLYSSVSGVNKLFCLDCLFCSGKKLYVGMVICIYWLHSCLCV